MFLPSRRNLAMARSVTEIRSLARSHTKTALNVLVAVMRNTKATPPARMAEYAILAQSIK